MRYLVKSLTGSKLYGLDNAYSDTDYSSIYLPTLSQLLLGKVEHLIHDGTSDSTRKNTTEDSDHEILSLSYFIELACKGKQQVIDLLHSNPNTTLISSPIWEELQSKRRLFYSKAMSSSVNFIAKQVATYGDRLRNESCLREVATALNILASGYSKAKLYKFAHLLPINEYACFVKAEDGVFFKEVKWTEVAHLVRNVFYCVDGTLVEVSLSFNQLNETITKKLNAHSQSTAKSIKENKGKSIKWSEISHAMRVGYQVLSILTKGDFSYPLPESDFLRKIKSGELDFAVEVQPAAETLVADIKRLMLVSTLPDAVDIEYWDQWLLDVYKREFLT